MRGCDGENFLEKVFPKPLSKTFNSLDERTASRPAFFCFGRFREKTYFLHDYIIPHLVGIVLLYKTRFGTPSSVACGDTFPLEGEGFQKFR